jgi:hypothetical protein
MAYTTGSETATRPTIDKQSTGWINELHSTVAELQNAHAAVAFCDVTSA